MTTPVPTKEQLQKFIINDSKKSGIDFDKIAHTRKPSFGEAFTKNGTRVPGYEIIGCYSKPGFSRLKILNPKGNKYLSKKDSGSALYLSPLLPKTIDGTLYITEGEKKADKGCQEGFATLGLIGNWGWRENKQLLPELIEYIQREDVQKIVVIWDNDAWLNPSFAQASVALKKAIDQVTITKPVKFLILPFDPADLQKKIGLDDYLLEHGSDSFKELLASAKETKTQVWKPCFKQWLRQLHKQFKEEPQLLNDLAELLKDRFEKQNQKAEKKQFQIQSAFQKKILKILSPEVAESVPLQLSHKELDDSFILECLSNQERGDAELVREIFKEQKLYDFFAKSWLDYEKGIWKRDHTGRMRDEAIPILTKIYIDLSVKLDQDVVELLKNTDPSDEIKEKIKRLGGLRDTLRNRVKALNNRNRINNVLDLATGKLPALSTEFDANPYELNLLNSVYNFKSDTFRDHSPRDCFYKQAQVVYDHQAGEPRYWLQFLRLIFNDDHKLIAFIQRCVGYSMTGLTDLQVILFCYGGGQNGKSTFFALLRLLLQDYYTSLPVDTLLTKVKSSSDEYQLSKLKGARMVVADEIPKGRRLQENMVKNLTGGEQINARNPYEKPFDFDPTHTLWLFGNHKPVIQGTDEGIWRRVHLIPFTIKIDNPRDMKEVLDEFKSEMPEILRWAINGYKDYFKNGLQAPDAVLSATKEYREESDALGVFFDECCIEKNFAQCQVKVLFSAYTKWCDENSETPILRTSRQLTSSLRERGFEVEKGTGGMRYIHGLGLKTTQKESKT